MLVSLAPVRFSWSVQQLQRFYAQAADWPVDIVYLGETFCGKRRVLSWQQWQEIGENLVAAGKQVVYSSNSTHDSSMSIMQLQRMCKENDFQLEVADMGYLQLLQTRRRPHVVGHSINVGTKDKLARFAELGMTRWVMPRQANIDYLVADMRLAQVYEQERNFEVETSVYGMFQSSASVYCTRDLDFNPLKDCKVDCDIGKLSMSWHDPQAIREATFVLSNHIARLAAWGANVFRVVPNSADMGPVLANVSAEVAKLSYVDLPMLLEQEWQMLAEQRIENELRMIGVQ